MLFFRQTLVARAFIRCRVILLAATLVNGPLAASADADEMLDSDHSSVLAGVLSRSLSGAVAFHAGDAEGSNLSQLVKRRRRVLRAIDTDGPVDVLLDVNQEVPDAVDLVEVTIFPVLIVPLVNAG